MSKQIHLYQPLRVIRILDQLKLTRGLPKMICVDKGPEIISFKLDHYYHQNHITLVFIQPVSQPRTHLSKDVTEVSAKNYLVRMSFNHFLTSVRKSSSG